MIKEEREPDDDRETCRSSLTRFYHSKAYVIYCIVQVSFLLILIIMLFHDQATQLNNRFSYILVCETVVMLPYIFDIILRIIVFKKDVWQQYQFIADFVILILLLICSLMIYGELHVKLNQNADIVFQFIRVTIQTSRIVFTLQRIVQIIADQKKQKILIDTHTLINEKKDKKKDNYSIGDIELSNGTKTNRNTTTIALTKKKNSLNLVDKEDEKNETKKKQGKFNHSFSSTDIGMNYSKNQPPKGMTTRTKNVTSGLLM